MSDWLTWIDGWKTKAGAGAGVVGALVMMADVAFERFKLPPEVRDAIMTLVVSLIGYGLAKKGEKTEKAVDVLTNHTAIVANEVRKVAEEVKPVLAPGEPESWAGTREQRQALARAADNQFRAREEAPRREVARHATAPLSPASTKNSVWPT